jgi:hypothetical protein
MGSVTLLLNVNHQKKQNASQTILINCKTMKLSTQSITKIADALKPAVINYIYEDPEYAEYMQTAVIEGIRAAMGDMDDDLLFEIGMLVFDRIELK